MENQNPVAKERWFWPTIVDLHSATVASNKGVWASGIVAVLTFVAATASLAMSKPAIGLDASAYIDAVLFGLIGWGIYRRNRIAAVSGLVLFVLEKILQLAAFGLGILGLAISGYFIVLFIIGIKGTFAYHRLKDFPIQ